MADFTTTTPELKFSVHTAVALSGFITPVVRGAFPVAPLHVSRAPVAGSGKSYLWDIAAMIAIGQLMPVMAAGSTSEELEKRLGSSLMTGQPLICIDNVIGELGGEAICQAVERPIVDVRILGKSQQMRIEASGTTFFASGNNIVIVGDLCRRTITTTLDPRMERPELREFKKDPVAVVLEDRGKYIAACLTICCAYFAAGRPNPAPKLASFEGWSDCVRSALIWLGCDDPVKSIEIAREEDPERTELSEMLTAWINHVGLGYGSRVTLATVIALVEKVNQVDQENPYLEKEKEPAHPELLTAVTSAVFTVTGRRQQKPDVHSLGQWLRARKGRVVDGKRFAYKPNPKGGSDWWVEEASVSAVPATAVKVEAPAAPADNSKEAPPPLRDGKKATRF